MRLIDADALIELFREVIGGIARKPELNGNLEHMVRASAMVIEMIKDAPTIEPERNWIPCSERLPEINHFMYDVEPFSDDVLVAIKNEYGADDTRIAYLEQKHGWILNMDDGFRWMVIAWMPLPEPYQEDKA